MFCLHAHFIILLLHVAYRLTARIAYTGKTLPVLSLMTALASAYDYLKQISA